jgi:hypothetical protein
MSKYLPPEKFGVCILMPSFGSISIEAWQFEIQRDLSVWVWEGHINRNRWWDEKYDHCFSLGID